MCHDLIKNHESEFRSYRQGLGIIRIEKQRGVLYNITYKLAYKELAQNKDQRSDGQTGVYRPWQKSCRLGTNWPEVPSNIFLINIFLQEMAHFNPNSFWNNVLVQNETVEKYSNVHSLVKPIESIFAKTKVLSPCHMMHPILD